MKGKGGIISISPLSSPLPYPRQAENEAIGYSAESDLKKGIADGLKKWDGKSPAFVSIQANPWQVNYQNFVNAVNQYKDNPNVVFVRPDVYFELMREQGSSGDALKKFIETAMHLLGAWLSFL